MILIRRVLAGVGLVLLAPIAVGLIGGSMSLTDAGIRAVSVLVAVVVFRRLVPRAVTVFADTLDGTWRGEPVSVDPDDAPSS